MELIPEFPRVVTSSMRERFSSCAVKFKYETVLGLQPKGEESVHLHFGGAYAKAMESYRRVWYETQDYDTAVAEGLRALIVAYGSYEPPAGEKKTFDRLVAAYVEALVQYPPGKDHMVPVKGTLGRAIEFSFCFETGVLHPVTGEPILFAGRFDQLVDFNSAIFVFDDKTTKQMGPLWRKQWELRSQFTAYTVGANVHGYKVAGAVIRGCAVLVNEIRMAEALTYRPEWMVERWKARLVYDLNRMIEMWKLDYWPHEGEESGECTTYGVCPYHMLCSSPQPEAYYEAFFERKRWDPINREMINLAILPASIREAAQKELPPCELCKKPNNNGHATCDECVAAGKIL